ncbi:thermonuclease family protein [Bailinhaonella thermotolerans]|uniref:TNase-like domain-containing protein n=1 Tax=Bailinhaonella thermotolerans TaxID=1070861 RepID=A0A3A4AAR0_9ACTN|nr:hypothetical protein [Bailinhaonella thermotolerans]RJL25179.1 hypothetical protein D5H75_28020 [Bailinhaonella thermotolerans]
MAKAIEQLRSGTTVGHAMLGLHRGAPGTVERAVHDGDTINVAAVGNLGVRFLGVDAPEVSFTLPARPDVFVPISDAAWTEFLVDPFAPGLPPLRLRSALKEHLLDRLDKTTAPNHARHATISTTALRTMVGDDVAAQGLTPETFRFRLSFAAEIIDRYGRLLCYVNREQRETPRPPTYNERLLAAGHAAPYFIWPNVNPFRRQAAHPAEAVPRPGGARALAESDGALRNAREMVRAARQAGLGVWERADPLRLLPFELRYLAQRRAPERYVLDLSDEGRELFHPQDYFRIPHPEDRLYVNAEHVGLFREKGWSVPAP